MSFRDRPKLSDRLRGKSGDELINEIKKEFEDNKKNWFNSGSPRFNAFKREGFPFDNDNIFDKSDTGIKSHLEDLAKKHPEFAGDLRCPPWGGSVENTWDKAYTIPVAVEKDQVDGHHSSSSQQNQTPSKEPNSESKPDDSLKQHGLRNTVDIAEQIQKANKKQEDEPKRSCSAPPAASSPEQSTMSKEEPKRFTSKIEITPVNPYEENMASAQASAHVEGPNATATASSTANASSQVNSSGSATASAASNENKTSNERQIPIRTVNSHADTGSPRMTREIPIITEKNQTRSPYDSPTMGRKQPQVRHIPIFVEGRKEPVVSKDLDESPEQSKQFPQEQTPLKRKLDSNGGNRAASPAPNGQSQQKQQPPQKKEIPVEQPAPPAPPPPPPKPKEPLERIQEVRQEVESLASRVEQYNGNSRTDKEYLYLDEMLTRELIKLDTIEVEGNDSLRTARKDVIKTIQQAIALLESKADSGKPTTETNSGEVASTNSMEVEVDDSQNKTSNAESGPEKNSG